MATNDPGDAESSEADSQTLGDLYNRLRAETEGDLYPPGRRVQAAVATFCIVRDHHLAITLLLDSGLYASAFALTRPLYEATVKGVWLAHCATEAKAESYAKGKELPHMKDLLEQVLNSPAPALVTDQLKKVKTQYWKPLSSFIHAGHAQVSRWMTLDGVGSKYSEREISELANFTAFMAVVSSLERARLGQNEPAMIRIAAMLPDAASERS